MLLNIGRPAHADPNHKPEMALALTPFTALCGFLPLPQIAAFLSVVPEFSALVPPSILKSFQDIQSSSDPTGPSAKAALKDVFSAVMTTNESDIKVQLDKLIQRYSIGKEHADERSVKDLVLTLNEQFPGDIGVFCAFMLNYVQLKPGEAIFLGAG